jgi:hypothetical protein
VYEMWVDSSIFELECPLGLDPLNEKRYNTSTTEQIAISVELYGSLPPHLQDILMDERWCPSFKKTVSSS